jgi:elongation factor P
MIDANALRKGVIFSVDGQLFKVLDYEHKKPGRGLATIRVKAVNLRSGANIEKTFSSSEKVENIKLDYHKAQYLYQDDRFFYFMDNDTFEQSMIGADVIGDLKYYLLDQMEVKLTFFENEPLDIEIPITVELKVTRADPAVRGDTATGVNKKVLTETGLEVNVPAFVEEGDVIKVDTTEGHYITRV